MFVNEADNSFSPNKIIPAGKVGIIKANLENNYFYVVFT